MTVNEDAIRRTIRETIRERPPNGKVGFTPATWAALISMVIAGFTVVGILASQIFMTRADAQVINSKMVDKINAINTNVQVHIRGKHGDLASWPEGR